MNTSRSFHPVGLAGALVLALTACNASLPHEREALAPTNLDRASTPAGSWAGSSRFRGSPNVHTTLQIDAPNGAGGSLRYGGPVNCRIDLADAGASGETYRYDVTDANGGACDHALAGHLEVVARDGTAAITLFDASDKPLGDGTLQPTP
ncbi:hypothetical protein H0E84_08875 [Luteimonas sp. SJ-92]|uniref:Uncharacterized protein n=1 Tax=Luteimonas salinisoli TaxID=2752307 RepID=A0A853JD47_9GAMM|nr:hypothetical protein [Luteimonas salinisoli]NZA26498.1 hypothetical protein [Luteimonas salinisoli]